MSIADKNRSILSRPFAQIKKSVSVLTANSFELLLNRLDGDALRAAEKYETLRLKIVKFLTWKGCPESTADALADETLDRTAGKLGAGETIENLNAYALQVARFVWLEHSRKRKEDAVGDDKMPENFVQPDIEILRDAADVRLRCLRKCLAETISNDDDRRLIIGYYDADAGEKNKDARKNLADGLGLTMTTLKVKACRLRERLERCINDCAAKLNVTERAVSDTTNRRKGGER